MSDKLNHGLFVIIYNLVAKNKAVDKDFINKLIEIIVEEYSLNDYVKKLRIVNKPWNGSQITRVAEYGLFSNIITVNLQCLLETLKYECKKIGLDFLQSAYYIALSVAATIHHELEHAHQLQKYDYNDGSLETLVIRGAFDHINPFRNESYIDTLINRGYTENDINKILRIINYNITRLKEFNPMERLADYYSLSSIAEVLKKLGVSDVIVYNFCLRICLNYQRGYKKVAIPTEYYLSEVLALDYWPEIQSLSSESDLETRLSLGLELTEEEKIYLDNTIMDLSQH